MALEETIKGLKVPVIAVIFADKPPKNDVIAVLDESGFQGVMVDTAIKNGQSLLDHYDDEALSSFVSAVHQQNMMCGLAGALRIKDIERLQPLEADYLGFRSALCDQQKRTSKLQLDLAAQVQYQIKGSLPAS